VAARPAKLSAGLADKPFVDICRETPMKLLWNVMALAALLGAVASAQDAPKKITKSEALSAVTSRVQPEYPSIARQLKVQGTVELNVVVAENGSVAKVDIVSGNPMLTVAAADALKRWKFKPFTEDGKPIQIMAPITVDFKL
jgi:TonB family protein